MHLQLEIAFAVAALPAYAIVKLVMGDELEAFMQAGSGTATSIRTMTIQAVCDRP